VLNNLREDTRRLREHRHRSFPWYFLEGLLLDNGYQAVVLHRIAHWFRSRHVPFLGPAVARLAHFLTGVDIGAGAEIGPGLLISHGTGIVVGGYTRIGGGATLLHQVTLGAPSSGRVHDMPRLGDRVFVGAGAKIIGAVEIGDDCFIGVNAVVSTDVPAGSKVVSDAPTEIYTAAP